MLRIVLATLVLVLIGCGRSSPTPSVPPATASPDLVRPFLDGSGHSWRLLVYDPAGLLADVQQEAQGAVFDPEIRWDPMPGSPHTLFLQWTGGVCTTDRTLTVARQGSRVSLHVFEGENRPLASSEACAAVGIIYRFRLAFDQPINTFDITVGLTELPL